MPELIEFLNDEEAFIRIEVLETLTELLEQLDPRLIERDFLKAFVEMFDVGIEELLLRVAKIFGRVVHGLKHFDMHKIYAEKFLLFFEEICRHKDPEMRK